MTALHHRNNYGLSFHHFGLAVEKPEQAIKFLEALGYQIGQTVFDPLQNVHLAMGAHPDQPDVEIIFPAESAGPLDKLLKQHKDGLVYHLCYTVEDPHAAVDEMEADGLRVFCVAPPKKAVLFEGREVSFYIVAGVGLIELIREQEGAL